MGGVGCVMWDGWCGVGGVECGMWDRWCVWGGGLYMYTCVYMGGNDISYLWHEVAEHPSMCVSSLLCPPLCTCTVGLVSVSLPCAMGRMNGSRLWEKMREREQLFSDYLQELKKSGKQKGEGSTHSSVSRSRPDKVQCGYPFLPPSPPPSPTLPFLLPFLPPSLPPPPLRPYTPSLSFPLFPYHTCSCDFLFLPPLPLFLLYSILPLHPFSFLPSLSLSHM